MGIRALVNTMKNSIVRRFPTATSLLLASLLALPLASEAQSRSREKNAQERGQKAPSQKAPTHARREGVRDQDVPPRRVRDNAPRPTPMRGERQVPIIRSTTTLRSQRSFTRTTQGRRYDNGMALRPAVRVSQSWERPFFPRGHNFYPYYQQRYNTTSISISPFGFYFGVVPAYISRAHTLNRQPGVAYIEEMVYGGDRFRGYIHSSDSNYFEDRSLGQRQPGLMNALDELHEAFRSGNIDSLVALTDPNTEIAIYQKGEYVYSLSAGDYLDLTRDALASVKTLQFDLTLLHKRADGVFVASGKHLYRDRNNRSRTVYVSYVLESIQGQWTLTQVGTAPDRVQEWN